MGFQLELCCRHFGLFWIWRLFGTTFWKIRQFFSNLLVTLLPVDSHSREYWRGKYHCTIDLLFDWFGMNYMITDNFWFYLQNRLFQTSQTGGQQYSDTSPFSIPWSFRQLQNSTKNSHFSDRRQSNIKSMLFSFFVWASAPNLSWPACVIDTFKRSCSPFTKLFFLSVTVALEKITWSEA